MTIKPSVSICLPNLRNRPYLPERIDSICAQTLADWELVVFDNFSDDGAWEYLCERAAQDPRIKVTQAPREGMYANWNNCIRAATGKYIYIATSDDNMAPDCLEVLVAALDAHPDCGVAHCRPHIFGENFEPMAAWWRSASPLAVSCPNGDVTRSHVRMAPLDGLLHATGKTVIISITQALIRRDVFARVGFFPNDCGVVGDFAWHAAVGFSINSVYVAHTWGGWRLHAAQATALNDGSQAKKAWANYQLFVRVVDSLGSAVSPETRRMALTARSLAYVHAVHIEGRGRSLGRRLAAVALALFKTGLIRRVVSWGPQALMRYVSDPANYALAQAHAPKRNWVLPL